MSRHETEAAQAAKQIRQILKHAFPGIKFSVRSRNFSMGDAVDIGWTDGPTRELVNAKTSQFQEGNFDGMTDSYNLDNLIDGLPQVKFVQTHRHVTRA